MKSERLVGSPDTFRKTAQNKSDQVRLTREVAILGQLEGSNSVPMLKLAGKTILELEYIEGHSLLDWIKLQTDDWTATAVGLNEALPKIRQYVEAEMALLEAGVLYRDMDPAHVIFRGNRAYMVDLEAAITKSPQAMGWFMDSRRGTWETMAPEEFAVHVLLTERTATYRVAVLTHLVLAGNLPFARSRSSKSATHHMRKRHPAQSSTGLPRAVQKVFKASLQVEPARRHRDPASFLQALEQACQ